MKKLIKKKAPRKPRSDAERNRAHILEVAKHVFKRSGTDASMGEIARRAKVGPGTLYRHFTNRDALVESVYLEEVEKLAAAQVRFSMELSPSKALRAWMLVFIDYISEKKLIGPLLDSMDGGPGRVFQQSSRLMEEAATTLARNAVAAGDLRPDVEPMDLLRAIYGIASTASDSEWPARARIFVDILLQGASPTKAS